ncbi:hypothetical protein C8D77_12123 [Mesorhizobium loti]|uniref:Uncharacterized protein n=1 Tax=Rhizobium loti TaxID=381 RepID=A0A8E2W5W5_RHILI|nr:hypothetical protein C8D77_12123 [Mesorhizobium loti]
MAATERTKSQCLIANLERIGGRMCGDANARHYGRLAVSAEPLEMVSQRVPNHAKSEWNATLLQHRPHDADRMTHSESLKIRMHPVRSELAYQEINLANREEMAQQVRVSCYAVHIRADCANLRPCTGPATTA